MRALRLVMGESSLWKYVVGPAILNLAGFGAGLWLVAQHFLGLTRAIWERPEGGLLLVLWHGLAALVVVMLVGAVLGGVMVLASIVAAPFNEAISERIEMELGRSDGTPFTWRKLARDSWTAATHSLLNVALYLLAAVPVLLLNLIPGAGSLLSGAMGFVLTSFMLALEHSDSPLGRRGRRWREKVGYVRANLPVMLGLGAGIWLLLWVPVVNLVLIPVATAAGTLVYVSLDRAGPVAYVRR